VCVRKGADIEEDGEPETDELGVLESRDLLRLRWSPDVIRTRERKRTRGDGESDCEMSLEDGNGVPSGLAVGVEETSDLSKCICSALIDRTGKA
jgi:hypothetical protein